MKDIERDNSEIYTDIKNSDAQTENEFSEHLEDTKKKLTKLIKYTVVTVAALMRALAITLIVDMIGLRHVIELEAGEALPSAASVSGHSNAIYVYDDNEIDIEKVGDYNIVIKYGNNDTMKIKVKVRDTQAPKGALKALAIHNGSSARPSAEDFFENIYDASEYQASFVNSAEINGLGDYDIEISLKDVHGNEKKYKTVLSVIVDTENPRITPPECVVGYVGEGIAYRSGVTISDNCFGATLEVDDSKVDTSKEGEYLVTYIVTDAAGNRVSAIIPVYIHKIHVTEEMLNERISKIAREQGMTKSLSKEELCKRIYKYVNDPTQSAAAARFQYVGFSNDRTRTDWRNEAYLTLQSGQGDCYSYFALAKAFFEYFDIENKDIERRKGFTADTHFWNMVNIGTSSNPRWYFFDATRYAGKFTVGGNNGCLLTKAQLEGYKPNSSGYGDNYYKFDSSSYPAPETEIINKNYSFD